MRKGFSLVEMLVVLIILAFLSVALAGLFTTVIKDIPHSNRIIQTNTTVLNMLEHLRNDINAATGLPESFGEYVANNEILLIELKDSVISYQVKDSKVLRCNMTAAEDSEVEDITIWSVPHAKVSWQVWKENGKDYAVQVKTHIEYEIWGHLERKMANSHLYFVSAFKNALR